MTAKPQSSFSDSLARFISDLMKMGDLQLQLLSVDLKSFSQSVRTGTILAAIALATLLGSLPILIFGAAGVFHMATSISVEVSCLLVGGTVAGASVLLLIVSVNSLTNATHVMKRSQEEFRRNLDWARSVLNQH